MQRNIVMGAVRGSNLRNILIGIALLAAVVVGMLLARRYYVSLFSGPQTISQNDLIEVQDADDLTQYWLTVTGQEAIDTGGEEIVTSTGVPDRVTARYVVLVLKDHFLLVKIPADVRINDLPDTFTGALVDIPPAIEDEIAGPLRQDMEDQNVDSELLPFMLDATDFVEDARLGLVVGGVMVLIAVVLLSMGVWRSISPRSHPYYTRLKRFGDPESVMQIVNTEVGGGGENIGGSLVTPNWLVHPKSSNFHAVPFKDVAWAYMKVIQRRVYGAPVGKTFQVCIWDRHGKEMTITTSEANVQKILLTIAQQAPWAILGHDPGLDKAWRKNRSEVLHSVDQRREQILRSQPASNAAVER